METIRYSKIYLEDLARGNGTDKVTLADGRVVSMTKIRIPVVVSEGTEAIAADAGSHSVTFGDIGTTDYQVTAEFSWFTTYIVPTKTTTGFTIIFGSEAPSDGTGTMRWEVK